MENFMGKDHGSETHSATRWPAPNCSIHCACTAAWPKANETEMSIALSTKFGEGRNFGVFSSRARELTCHANSVKLLSITREGRPTSPWLKMAPLQQGALQSEGRNLPVYLTIPWLKLVYLCSK